MILYKIIFQTKKSFMKILFVLLFLISLPASSQQYKSTAITNSGLVLLNGYIQTYLDRLGLLEGSNFKGKMQQNECVHYLQFLATGRSQASESHLNFNKLLCGLEIERPIANDLRISDANQNLSEGMLAAAINHWSAIGQSSIDGFRGNWLIRNGLLVETEDRWELKVEKVSYDILLNQSPFSFEIIKFPWMKKPIYVQWPY
jgi:hypothetical protein